MKKLLKYWTTFGEKFGVAIDWTSENIAPYLKIIKGGGKKYFFSPPLLWVYIDLALSLAASLFAIIKLLNA